MLNTYIMDVWWCVEESSNSSHGSNYSDAITSETEAELYSTIHHHENVSNDRCNERNENQNVYSGNDISITYEKIQTAQNNLSITKHDPDMFKDLPSVQNNSILKQEFQKVAISQISNGDTKSPNWSPLKKKASLNNRLKPEVIVLDSSDSDDMVWEEQDYTETPDLKINTSMSSNSEIIHSVPLEITGIKRKTSLPRNFNKGIIKDCWYVNDDDLYRRKNRSRRYTDSECSACGTKGHNAKSCKASKGVKCFYCGGLHLASYCENKICNRCYELGHDYRNCWMTFVNFCHHCNMKGHSEKDCPDIWRRYHLTTESINIVTGRPIFRNKSIYCFNCGWPGHFGALCTESRIQPGTTWPCVLSYNNPDELLSNRNDFQQNRNTYFTNDLIMHETQGFSSFITERKSFKNKFQKFQKFNRPLSRKQRKQALLKEKCFPRSPKQKKIDVQDVPESVRLMELAKKKRKSKKQRRQLRKQRLNSNLLL